jgi:ectoine hydroxylase-related dioxygenase (phytanoyl-CoA dioxygenase family)
MSGSFVSNLREQPSPGFYTIRRFPEIPRRHISGGNDAQATLPETFKNSSAFVQASHARLRYYFRCHASLFSERPTMSTLEVNTPNQTEYPLTAEQIANYRRDGFIVLEDVFTGDDLQQIRDAVAQAVESEMHLGIMAEKKGQLAPEKAGLEKPAENKTKGAYESLFIQKVNLWQRWPKVAAYVKSKRLGNIAARLEGAPMRVWHDQALFKEPKTGVKTPWHQDAVYWPHTERGGQTTIWIALKDATIHNGCMSFVGGTQKLGTMPRIDLGNPEDIFKYAPHIKPVKPTVCPLKAGSVTFHNGLTFHYAGPNKSDGMREAFAIIYMRENTIYDGRGHVLTDPMREQGLKVGDPLNNEAFPRVSD